MHRLQVVIFIVFIGLLGLSGCGSSSGGSENDDRPTNPDSGLQQRPITAEFQLPLSAPTGDLTLVPAFPNLDSFSQPVFATHSGDGSNRLFVVEQSGQIRVFTLQSNATLVTSSQVFLDIEDRVASGGEMGLLGLAFDPNYASNGYFYVYYTANSPRRSVLSRFQVSSGNANQGNPNSESVILEVEQPRGNHNGGTIAFGPDGYLYFGLGDGGGSGDPDGHGQDTTSLLGSMLRIDPITGGYTVPADNPYVNDGAVENEIWAYGLRNPYRFSFDRVNGDLWLADVGQNAIEEIDVIEKGGNYGWNWFEGNQVYKSGAPSGDYEAPVYQYSHSLGESITGGYVYRGSALPSLVGKYIYGDFISSRLWALSVDGGFQVEENELITTSPQNISGFAEDEAGELYIIGYSGTLFRLQGGDGGDPLAGFPSQLSDTGLFSDTASLSPASGLIEYDVNTALWTDYAVKQRWIALPNNTQIGFSANGAWQFPIGTVLVKHFAMNMIEGDNSSAQRLETRVLIHQVHGWQGVSYRWNSAQTDASLVEEPATEILTVADANFSGNERSQTYYYPGPGDCLSCHTQVAGRVLGVNTQQLNRGFDYPSQNANQLTSWNHIGLFGSDIGSANSYSAFHSLDDNSVSLEQRSREYLDANCAFCHQPGGTTPVSIDLRASTALANTQLVNQDPDAGDLGVDGAKLISPGDPSSSVLWLRMNANDENRMPAIGRNIQDPTALTVVNDWIESL